MKKEHIDVIEEARRIQMDRLAEETKNEKAKNSGGKNNPYMY